MARLRTAVQTALKFDWHDTGRDEATRDGRTAA